MTLEEQITNILWASRPNEADVASFMDPAVQLRRNTAGGIIPESLEAFEAEWGRAAQEARQDYKARARARLEKLASENPSLVDKVQAALVDLD